VQVFPVGIEVHGFVKVSRIAFRAGDADAHGGKRVGLGAERDFALAALSAFQFDRVPHQPLHLFVGDVQKHIGMAWLIEGAEAGQVFAAQFCFDPLRGGESSQAVLHAILEDGGGVAAILDYFILKGLADHGGISEIAGSRDAN
jgi:hypothetical protein